MSIWGHSKCTKRVKRGRGLIEKETKSDIWEGGLSRKNENTQFLCVSFFLRLDFFFSVSHEALMILQSATRKHPRFYKEL